MGVSSDDSGWVCLDWRTNIVWLLRSGSERIFRQETVEVPFSSGGCAGKTGIKRMTRFCWSVMIGSLVLGIGSVPSICCGSTFGFFGCTRWSPWCSRSGFGSSIVLELEHKHPHWRDWVLLGVSDDDTVGVLGSFELAQQRVDGCSISFFVRVVFWSDFGKRSEELLFSVIFWSREKAKFCPVSFGFGGGCGAGLEAFRECLLELGSILLECIRKIGV